MKKLRVKHIFAESAGKFGRPSRKIYIANMHFNMKCDGGKYVKRALELYYAQSAEGIDENVIDSTTQWLFTDGIGKPTICWNFWPILWVLKNSLKIKSFMICWIHQNSIGNL